MILIKRTYYFLRYAIIFAITLMVLLVVIAKQPEMLKYVGEKFIKKNGVEYSKIEGSLLGGAVLHDVNYKDAVLIKTLQVSYNPFLLINPTPTITKVMVDELFIYPKKLPLSEEDNATGTVSIIPFRISKLQLKNAHLILDDETLIFDVEASKVHYDNHLNTKELLVKLSTSYGKANLAGEIKSDHLYATATISPSESSSKKYLQGVNGLPNPFVLDVNASLQEVAMKTRFNKLSLNSDQNSSLKDFDVNLLYFIKDEYFSLNSSYFLSYGKFSSNVKQRATFTLDGNYHTDVNATLANEDFKLPFKRIFAEVYGSTEDMTGKINAGTLQLDFSTKEYTRFLIQAKSDELALSLIPNIPELLKKDVITFNADAMLNISPFSINGEFNAQGLYSTVKGNFDLNDTAKLYEATLFPKPNSELFKAYKLELFSPLKFAYYDKDKKGVLNLDANMFNLTLIKKEALITGWGNLGSVNFTAQGSLTDVKEKSIVFSAHVASINELVKEFRLLPEDRGMFFDGEVDVNATLFLSEEMKIKSRVNLPWYIINPDTQTSYVGENFSIESTVMGNEITVDQYSLNYLNQHIYSKRPSKISFDSNATVMLKEFWVYDNLLITGKINPQQMQGNLHIRSDGFVYNGAEGNVTAKTDIKIDLQSDGTQSIEGNVILLDGTVTYEPVTDYSISDDIIIIQDIKPYKESKRFINIHVSALKPITYKTKDIDIRFIPDMVIWQQPNDPLSLLGTLSIEDGKVTSSGKVFEFDKSEIYFNGAKPVNPYLNLNLHYYTLDYIDIEIFVSNTLGSPIVILSSKPAMSQNDIMSYILFGGPATSTFSNSGGSSNMSMGSILLATGLKQIFNDTSGVNIDTLNILTNKEGTLGYEIGARFSKEIRMIYKNDTTSSAILQYSLSRSIRIDIDVHEAGQGVNILYIKDFKSLYSTD